VRGTVVRNAAGDLTFGDGTTPLVIEGRAVRGSLTGSARGVMTQGPAAGGARTEAAAKLAVTLSPTLGRLLGALSSPDDDLRGTVALDLSAKGDDASLAWAASGTVTGLVYGGADGATPWSEPSATLDAAGTWAGGARRLVVAKATLTAVRRLRASPNFTVTLGEPMRIEATPRRPWTSPRRLARSRRQPDLAPGQRVAARRGDGARAAASADAFDVTLTGRDLWLRARPRRARSTAVSA
jgi:hypothetical protein